MLFSALETQLQSLTAQRRLVSDASHELRTPLASLRVNVDLLADDPGMSAAERQEVLARVVGRSQLDYLSPKKRVRQKEVVLSLLGEPPQSVPELIKVFLAGL